jgi:hypothetical protein
VTHLARLGVLAILVAACSTAIPSRVPSLPVGTGQPTTASLTTPSSPPAPSVLVSPSASIATDFAFDPESVLGYYRSIAYVCDGPVPGPVTGSTLRSCQLRDPDGRVRVIGFVTDPAGNIAAGFASMRGRPGEAFVDPETALEPLAGFLGAMLGEARGTELVPWLAGHLGDGYAETTSGDLAVLTYTQEAAGQTVLFVEVATDSYRSGVKPGPS